MSRIPQGKVLVKAGKFEGGKLPYLNYVGQIKPADLPRILWWGAFGDDATGDGTIGTPYETFQKALDEFSTTAHKWILKTDLSVYGEAGPGPYIDDPTDRVYLDPTRPDDSGDGLTPAAAKKTYAAAKTALSGSGRSVIHCIGSFTLTDLIDAPTQGEIGETLTLNAAPDYTFAITDSQTTEDHYAAIQTSSGALIVAGADPDVSAGASARGLIKRSTDGGITWSVISHPWNSVRALIYSIAEGGGVLIAVGIFLTTNKVLRSTDDGLTWSEVTVAAGVALSTQGVAFSGTNFVIFGSEAGGGFANRVFTSPDGSTWTSRTCAAPSGHAMNAIASNGAGSVMITGRASGTVGSMQFSTDHGVTWVNYPSVTGLGVGVNTGGAINYACAYASGKWWIFQDTIATSVYYSTSPTTLWAGMSDAVNMMAVNLTRPAVQIGYSIAAGGFIVPETDSLGGNLMLVTDTSAVLFSSIGLGFYDNFVSLPFTHNGGNFVLIAGRTSSYGGRTAILGMDSANIFSNVTNAKTHASIAAKFAPGISTSFLSSEPTAGKAVYSAYGCEFQGCKVVSADDSAMTHSGDIFKARRNLIKGTIASIVNGTAAAQDDIAITQNTIIGGVTLNNAGGTDKELIQDNIIEGNFAAAAATTVQSNIRGAVVNASGLSKISSINPLFADEIDYELSRIALGQSIDSPLAKRSAVYSYLYDSVTYPDDFGPYRAFVALVQTSYKRAFLLPKFSGNALSEDIENAAALLRSINGVPDVSNRPEARLEILSWSSKSVDAQVREFISFIERERNMQCELYIDYDESVLDDIEVDGVHTSGTFEVNIQPKDVPVGAVLSLFGKLRYVVQRYPRSGEATKLILDDVLSGGLSDGQAIEIEQLQGAGTFVFVPEQRRQNVRVFSRRRDTYTGMKYTFARKAL